MCLCAQDRRPLAEAHSRGLRMEQRGGEGKVSGMEIRSTGNIPDQKQKALYMFAGLPLRLDTPALLGNGVFCFRAAS